MEAIKTELVKILKEKVGERITDNKCCFCGKILECGKYCDCRKAEKINRYYKKAFEYYSKNVELLELYKGEEHKIKGFMRAKIPALYSGMTMDDYIVKNESQRNVVKTLSEYKKNILENYIFGRNLILFGNYRTGKTMIMSILAEDVAEMGFKVKFINAVDLINDIKASFNGNADQKTTQILDSLKCVDFLFIDDIDKVNPTQYVRELMYAITNNRKENEKPIIVSMNHTLEELDEQYFSEAIVSRIAANSTTINFTHENWELSR